MDRRIVLTDAHTHMGTEAEMGKRKEQEIVSLVCASTPREAKAVFAQKGRFLIPTCGVHPWDAHRQQLKDLEGWMEKCPVIGEIGMDSVWCQVPLAVQEEVFLRQLDLAMEQKKPVILHTKGQEKAIAAMIRQYPNRYLVHWYSCREYLEEYLDQDCYFSVGPDVGWNQAVMDVVKKVPVSRLLVETDGLQAVRWAYEEGYRLLGVKAPKNIDVRTALTATLESAAQILGIRPWEAGLQFKENLVSGFLKDCLNL